MRRLFCSSRSFVVVNGKSIFLTFTVKQIMLRIIWPILATLSFMGCTFLILDRCLSHWLRYNLIGASLPRLVKVYDNI
ncbi:hypothetical protein LINGRAHAP2_LOCUS26270 [Linum grandiflorum]